MKTRQTLLIHGRSINLALIKVDNNQRSQIFTKKYREPIIFFRIFSDGLYVLAQVEDWVELKHNSRSTHEAFLREQPFMVISDS